MRQPVHIFPLRVSAASVSTVLYHRWVRRETRTKRRVWNERGIHLDLLLSFVVAEKKLKFIEPNAENDESVDVDYHALP